MASTTTSTFTPVPTLKTSHGELAVRDIGPLRPHSSPFPALLLLHGNSSSSTIFKHIFASPLASSHRLIAFDLPGHGASSDAPNPANSYSMPGYADAAVEVLQQLGVKEVIVMGWSLGGHIAIEMIPRFAGLKGIMIVGTPPVARGQVASGFYMDPHMSNAGNEKLSQEDIEAFAKNTAGAPYEEWMLEAVTRTDGRARKMMFDAFREGKGVDQMQLVGETKVLTAVVNGAAEPFINVEFIDGIKFGNLWQGKCIKIKGLGHAPFWEEPEPFQEILQNFVDDCGK